MAIDYDMNDPEACAEGIYQELRSLPSEIRKNLHRLLKERPITEPEKEMSPELAMPRVPHFPFTSEEDFRDVEY
jgi:hypothetical protein